MKRKIAIGKQSFEIIREKNCFYIDKTDFIRQWWESEDDVTLIARPRRFGKTLNMDMLNCFFSNKYEGRSDLFEGLSVWEDEEYGEKYRAIQGKYPVIFLSFASVKGAAYDEVYEKIKIALLQVYNKFSFLKESSILTPQDRQLLAMIDEDMNEAAAASSLNILSDVLSRYYGRKVIILLDEYDTPLQEAYVGGYWDEMAAFIRSFFNSTFKTNPYLERAVMTGITRVSKESIFSDLNNLKVVTITSDEYADCFGFTEKEVFDALDEFGMGDAKEKVKYWYDGFTFGTHKDIYNPWSILNYLDTGKFEPYWANTSGNALVSKLIREAGPDVKTSMEGLLEGGSISCRIDEQIVFSMLDENEEAIWSLLLATGYIRAAEVNWNRTTGRYTYVLELTNFETHQMFENLISDWFKRPGARYNDFIKALLRNDLEAMNAYMNKITESVFSYFDTDEEKFYHGFVLGLIADADLQYRITSNRESGFGRYDVCMIPKAVSNGDTCGGRAGDAYIVDGTGSTGGIGGASNETDIRFSGGAGSTPAAGGPYAYVFEFKIFNPRREQTLEETADAALRQIGEKNYDAEIIAAGIDKSRIRHYGFAFRGKEVLIAGE